MHFLVVRPTERRVDLIDSSSVEALRKRILPDVGVDFGAIAVEPAYRLGIVAFEYGLLEGNGPYFTLGNRQLYAGDCIIFATDHNGEPVSMPSEVLLRPIWLPDVDAVEKAIEAGQVQRPFTSINGKVIWEWNSNRPI